jgi:hypothetical protein
MTAKMRGRALSATTIVARRAVVSGQTCGRASVMTIVPNVARVICRHTRVKMRRSDGRADARLNVEASCARSISLADEWPVPKAHTDGEDEGLSAKEVCGALDEDGYASEQWNLGGTFDQANN